MADTPPAPPTSTFTQRLNRLHDISHPPGRPRPSLEDTAAGVSAASGTTISSSYFHKLLTGQQRNPSYNVLQALAKFYGVDPQYFFTDPPAAERTEAQLELALALQDDAIRHLTVRAAGLSTKSLRKLTDMVNLVRELEGLRDDRSPDDLPP